MHEHQNDYSSACTNLLQSRVVQTPLSMFSYKNTNRASPQDFTELASRVPTASRQGLKLSCCPVVASKTLPPKDLRFSLSLSLSLPPTWIDSPNDQYNAPPQTSSSSSKRTLGSLGVKFQELCFLKVQPHFWSVGITFTQNSFLLLNPF